MSISGLVTGGWISEPSGVSETIIVNQTIAGTVAAPDVLAGVLATPATLSGALVAPDALAGALTTNALAGTISTPGALVGVITCDGEALMADITMTQGDSRTLEFEINDDLGADVDLTGAILRLGVKHRPDDANADAVIFKTTYRATEITITDAAQGLAVAYIRVDDTHDAEPGAYCWDLEVTRQGSAVAITGTITAAEGSDVLAYTGADFANFRVGQYLLPAGATSPNQQPVVITALDADTQEITTGAYNLWATQAAFAFTLFEGTRDTPAGLSGTFTLNAGVVR